MWWAYVCVFFLHLVSSWSYSSSGFFGGGYDFGPSAGSPHELCLWWVSCRGWGEPFFEEWILYLVRFLQSTLIVFSGSSYLCLVIWSSIDSGVGGLIWQGLLAADTAWWLSCRAFYENMDKILIFRWLGRIRCKVFEGGLFVHRSCPCSGAYVTLGFSQNSLRIPLWEICREKSH